MDVRGAVTSASQRASSRLLPSHPSTLWGAAPCPTLRTPWGATSSSGRGLHALGRDSRVVPQAAEPTVDPAEAGPQLLYAQLLPSPPASGTAAHPAGGSPIRDTRYWGVRPGPHSECLRGRCCGPDHGVPTATGPSLCPWSPSPARRPEGGGLGLTLPDVLLTFSFQQAHFQSHQCPHTLWMRSPEPRREAFHPEPATPTGKSASCPDRVRDLHSRRAH